MNNKPTIHNNTHLALEVIEGLPIIGKIKNNWRGRMVELYASDSPGMAYMVGRTFDGQMVVISHEPVGMNERAAIDYWQHGQKTLVRD
jgi:hypothetical protein